MSFAQILASRKPAERLAFSNDPPAAPKLLFIKPISINKNARFEKLSEEELKKEIEVTKKNLKMKTIDEKGKERLENLLHKYEAELEKRLSANIIKIKTEIKEEMVKDEPTASVTSVPATKETAKEPIFHVSDDLLSKMQTLTINPRENTMNVAKPTPNTSKPNPFAAVPSSSSILPSLKLKPSNKNKVPEKTIKVLSLEESTELVKQKRFISKSNPKTTIPDFDSDDDESDDDGEDGGFDVSDNDSQTGL